MRLPSLLLWTSLVLLSACVPRGEQGIDCENDRDDDGDNLTDCEDPSCAFEPTCATCGNGVLDLGEACDDGNVEDGDDCTSRCLDPDCGNGKPERTEECDDGNLIPADGCSVVCKRDRCGDRIIQPDIEDCEDGNRADGDGCSSVCRAEPLFGCGDFQIAFDPETFEQLEQCDDGDRQSGDGCSASCTLEFCGDGVLQPALGEQCETADPLAPPECVSCRIPRCGDGFFTPNEQCDDGNTRTGDGCSATCRAEFCGDGIVQAQLGESCDDADQLCGDGCCFCSLD